METFDKDGQVVTDPAFAAELRLNRSVEGRDPLTGALPVHEHEMATWDGYCTCGLDMTRQEQ